MRIINAQQQDLNDWQHLALKLWPDYSNEEMRFILSKILDSSTEDGFLVRDANDKAIAFMNLSLRFDYVPGAVRSPVAYVEGIYVEEEYRNKGMGRCLIHYAEQWALKKNCFELASDALLENIESHNFHEKVGFKEVERVVTYIKPIATHT